MILFQVFIETFVAYLPPQIALNQDVETFWKPVQAVRLRSRWVNKRKEDKPVGRDTVMIVVPSALLMWPLSTRWMVFDCTMPVQRWALNDTKRTLNWSDCLNSVDYFEAIKFNLTGWYHKRDKDESNTFKQHAQIHQFRTTKMHLS